MGLISTQSTKSGLNLLDCSNWQYNKVWLHE